MTSERIHLTYMDLVLDNNKKEYVAGDKVSGLLKIRLKGRLLLSNLKIRLLCIAEVKWIENPGTRYHRSGHVYHDKKNFFESTYQIPDQYADNCLIEGEYEIPFTFQLPEKDIPSSFRSPHGSVTYFVEVVIDEPAIDEVHRNGTEIVVDSPFRQNLNLSIGNSVEKDFGLLSFGSGKVTVYASLSKKGFYPGELIELHTTVENNSSVEATPRATLYQTRIYMCGERHKAYEDAVCDAVEGTTVAKNTEHTDTLYIKIPDDLSLSIKSGIVNIKYFIHVTLDIPHAIDIHVNIPIIMTTKSVIELLSGN